MASRHLMLPKNAQELYCRKSVPLGEGSFEKYKKWVEKDKSLLPLEELSKGGSKVLWKGLEKTLQNIDFGESDRAFRMLRRVALICATTEPISKETQLKLETRLKNVLSYAMPEYELLLAKALKSRSTDIYNTIAPYLEGKNMLDIGCGDGCVGKLVYNRKGMSVQLLDVIDYNKTDLPFTLFDGKDMPFGTNQFDLSLVGMVFHHAENPIRLIEETARVTKKRAIVIESIELNRHYRGSQAFGDWFYNRVLHTGVNVPCNFQTPSGWRDTFGHFGFVVKLEKHLGIDMPLAPEFHTLYVLEKK